MTTIIRNVVDARFDIEGGVPFVYPGHLTAFGEDHTSSLMTGWTTHWHQSILYYLGAQMASNAYYAQFKDSGNSTPHQDGMEFVTIGPGPTYANIYKWQLTAPGQVNVGLRHYWQQMQAMKGDPGVGLGSSVVAGHYDVNSPSRYDSSAGLEEGIEPVSQGSGTYKHMNVSMSYMRGFKYPTNASFHYESTKGQTLNEPAAGGVEHLDNYLEISVGNYTTPVWGCMDPNTTCNNYNPAATIDDGSCCY